MKNANRTMFEETGLIVGDEVVFKGDEWVVEGAMCLPKPTEIHCVNLIRTVAGMAYTTAAHSNRFSELRLINTFNNGA